MSRFHDNQTKAAQREPVIVTTSSRKGWSLATIIENDIEIVELRQLVRHNDGSFSPTKHRSTFRREVLPALIAGLAAIHAEGRR